MKKLLVILVFAFTSSISSQAIPTEVKKTVAFIYKQHSAQYKDSLVPQGTGFFVGVEDTLRNQERTHVYFVTAKHVLKENENFLENIYIRMNTRDSLSETRILNMNYNGIYKNVFTHRDSTVDIAVIPVAPDPSTFDYMMLPENYLTDRQSFKKLHISEGSDVFFTGMFTSYLGKKRNYPIVRFGRVALITDEKIPWDDEEETELYLIESSTFGGNSGSPVFFYLGAERGSGGIVIGRPEIKLAGIMKGYFGENTPLRIIETARIPGSNRNLGIAAVVPAYLLREILFGSELAEKRKL